MNLTKERPFKRNVKCMLIFVSFSTAVRFKFGKRNIIALLIMLRSLHLAYQMKGFCIYLTSIYQLSIYGLIFTTKFKLHYPYPHFLTQSSLLHRLNFVNNQMYHEQIATEIILTQTYFVYIIVYQEKKSQ